MHQSFDVLVIGTGTAGYTLALACSKAGRQVAIVDNQPYGGTCAMRGCQPKKYLVDAAEVVRLSQQMAEIGIHPAAKIDWPALMRSKSGFTNAVPERTERALQKAGIKLRYGTAGAQRRRGDKHLRPGNQVRVVRCRPEKSALGLPDARLGPEVHALLRGYSEDVVAEEWS